MHRWSLHIQAVLVGVSSSSHGLTMVHSALGWMLDVGRWTLDVEDLVHGVTIERYQN